MCAHTSYASSDTPNSIMKKNSHHCSGDQVENKSTNTVRGKSAGSCRIRDEGPLMYAHPGTCLSSVTHRRYLCFFSMFVIQTRFYLVGASHLEFVFTSHHATVAWLQQVRDRRNEMHRGHRPGGENPPFAFYRDTFYTQLVVMFSQILANFQNLPSCSSVKYFHRLQRLSIRSDFLFFFFFT